MNRGKNVPGMKLDLPDATMKANRRAAVASGIAGVPYGVQMVQPFTDSGTSSTSATRTASASSAGKRQKDANNLQPGINTAQDPEKTRVERPRA
jgi:hypothetical protein